MENRLLGHHWTTGGKWLFGHTFKMTEGPTKTCHTITVSKNALPEAKEMLGRVYLIRSIQVG